MSAAEGGRLRWEQDPRGRLLIFDCSDNTLEEARSLFDGFHAAVLAEPAGSVRVLADFENAAHEPALTRRWKEAFPEHNRQIRAFAAVGVTGGMKMVIAAYRFYARLRGGDIETKMRFFENQEEARAWLAES